MNILYIVPGLGLFKKVNIRFRGLFLQAPLHYIYSIFSQR